MSTKFHDLTTFRARPYGPADRDWVLARHLRHYEDVEGFDGSFRAAVESVLDAFERTGASSRSHAVVVEQAGRRIGCIFCTDESPDTARIRLFYLEPDRRGRGLGGHMVQHLLQHAREAGFRQVVVSTFERHRAACALYRSRGFRLERAEAVAAFGHHLVKLDFRLELGRA